MNAKHSIPQQTNDAQAAASSTINLSAAVQNLPRPQAEDVFHEHRLNRYWVQDEQERWINYTREDLRLRLRSTLMLSASPRDGLPAEVDCELDRIKQQQSVDAALPLAGYEAGLHRVLGTPVLVTTSPELLQPVQGDPTRFQARLRRMFGEEQATRFTGWLKYALSDFYEFLQDPSKEGTRNMGMSLVIAGASGLGKSLLLKIITKCLGGRMAFPAQSATGKTSFNEDLIGCEVQAFDDEGMGDAYSKRKEIGDFLKRTAAVEETRCHPKGRAAFRVRVFWRLIFSLNDEAENLQVLPPLERGVQDKVMMLRAEGSLLDEAEEHRTRNDNWQMLVEEMAWFIQWAVYELTLDETLLHPRWGVCAWQHPDLVEDVDSFAPEFRLLDLITDRGDLYKDGVWEGTARQLEVSLKLFSTPTEREAHELLKSSGSLGKYLGKLRHKRPERVQKLQQRDRNGIDLWRITAPERIESTTPTSVTKP